MTMNRSLRRHTKPTRTSGARWPAKSNSRATWLSVAAVACLQIGYVHCEDFGQAFSHSKGTSKSDETYIIISFSAFLAFCVLSVITAIAYFSHLEDLLMRRYLDEGEVVEAVIVSADFARGGGTPRSGGTAPEEPDDNMSTEFVLFVEYNKAIAEGSYMTKVRKQVKAKESDIIRPPHYNAFSYNRCEEAMPLDTPMGVQKMLRIFHDDENAVKEAGLGKIEMLVMPYFHKSGISRRQVERANGYRHRLSTMALILSGFGLAAFCIRLAAKAIANSKYDAKGDDDTNMVTLWMSAIFVALLLVELLFVHCCLRKIFIDALEEEYLKSGDLLPAEEDDSSLSTGSDFFLGKSPQERMKIINMPPNDQGSPKPIPSVVNQPSSFRVPMAATVDL